MMLSRVADWITVISAPLAIIGTLAPWLGWVGSPSAGAHRSETALSSIAVLIIASMWTFFFFGHLRVVAKLCRHLSEFAAFGTAVLISLITLVVFCALEILVLEALLSASSWPLVQLAWLVVPVLVWIVAGYYGVILTASGEYKRVL